MDSVTLGFAVFCVVLAISRRNAGAALGVLVASMMLWPEFLRLPIGPIQMSVPRFVALFLLVKFLIQGRHKQINFGRADALMIWLWLWTIFAAFLAGSNFTHFTYIIGRGLDTVLMYFVARMGFSSAEDARGIFKGLAVTALTMSIAGSYEAYTWHSPYHMFSDGAARIDEYNEVRYGLLRAQGSTMGSIYLGMAMVVVTALLWAIRGYVIHRFVILAAAFSVLSSLSSGPWLALLTLVFLNLYYKRSSWIKPSLRGLLFLAIAMELASNRHFYNLIDYLALDKHTAWYRTRLLEVAVSQWEDYWLVGVGSTWPHHWAAMLDGRLIIDIVNNFIIIALYGGLPGLCIYVATHVIAVKSAVVAFQNASVRDDEVPRRQLIFGLAAAIIALDFSSMSVGLYGPALLLSHILLGCALSVSVAWESNANPILKPSGDERIDGIDRNGGTLLVKPAIWPTREKDGLL